jgi:hypothetical protein
MLESHLKIIHDLLFPYPLRFNTHNWLHITCAFVGIPLNTKPINHPTEQCTSILLNLENNITCKRITGSCFADRSSELSICSELQVLYKFSVQFIAIKWCTVLMRGLFTFVMTPREVRPSVTGSIVHYYPVNTHQTTIIDFTSSIELSANDFTYVVLPLKLYQITVLFCKFWLNSCFVFGANGKQKHYFNMWYSQEILDVVSASWMRSECDGVHT